MQGLVRVYSEMDQERSQLMIDSLDKLVLFETSVEMNHRYDTKMFAKLIEEIQKKEENQLEASPTPKSEEGKKSEENTAATSDPIKGDEETKGSSSQSPTKDELYKGISKLINSKFLGSEYMDFIANFDQLGEYKFSEPTEENQNKISGPEAELSDPVKSKYEEEIYELVVACISNDQNSTQNNSPPKSSDEYLQKMDDFKILMDEKTARTVFLDCLNNYWIKEDTKINYWESFSQISDMVIICLNRIDAHDDRENSLRLIEVCDKFYIDSDKSPYDRIDSETQEKLTYKIYLTSSIENHKLVKDINFWEKIIFESIRKELRNEFFEYQYEIDTENAYKEIIYFKMSHIVSTMLRFKIDKDEIKNLVVHFCDSHELWREHRINLISKIANYESLEDQIRREKERSNLESEGEDGHKKARKGIPQWLQQIEAIQVPKVQETTNRYAEFAIFNKRNKENKQELKKEED